MFADLSHSSNANYTLQSQIRLIGGSDAISGRRGSVGAKSVIEKVVEDGHADSASFGVNELLTRKLAHLFSR